MIQDDVDHLADDAYYGRYWLSPFARKAAEWMKDQMEAGRLRTRHAGRCLVPGD